MANIIDVVMRLTDRVTDPLRRIRQQMEQTANMNQRLGRDIQNIGRGVSSIGESMMPAAAAITAVGVATGKTFMDFEATITGAAVKAGATTEAEFNKMRDVAGKLGAEFPITASQAAEGMDRLAAGGFDVNETIGAMPGIITAAVASGEDLAVTSDVITSALSIWDMKQGDIAENTTHVADVVQMAANKSKLGMQDFGLAMQYAGAPAAALGVSIEELGTAMAIMSNNGIQASTIGTSLRATMSRLASPPKAAAMAIEQLGLKINDANGKFVGLENIVGQMRTAMAGLSDTEQVALAEAIAGEDAYSGLLALIKTSPEAYADMTSSLQNATGSSAEAYAVMQNTLKGSIDSMMGSVEAFGIAMGTVMSPYIREAAETIKYFANVLTDMTPEQQKMIAAAAASVVGFTAFTLAAGKMISIAGSLVSVYGQIGRVMDNRHIRNKLLEYSVRGVMAAYSGLGNVATRALARLSSAGTAAGGVFSVIRQRAAALRALGWTGISANISSAFASARAAVAVHMAAVRTSAVNGLNVIRTRAAAMGNSVRAAAASMRAITWADIGASISRTFASAQASVTNSMASMRTSVTNSLTAVRNRAMTTASSLRAFAANLTFSNISANISSAFASARAAVATNMAAMRARVASGMAFIRAQAIATAGSLRAFAASLSLSSMASRAATAITAVGRSFLTAARAGLMFALSPIGIAMIAIAGAAYLIYSNWEKVGPFFTGLWNQIKAAFASAMQSLKPQIDSLKAAFDVLKNTVGTAVIAAMNRLRAVFGQLRATVGPAMSGAIARLGAVFTGLRATVGGAVISAFNRLKAAFDTIKAAIQQNQGTIDKIIGVFTTVATVVGGVVVGAFVVMANVLTGWVVAAIGVVTSIIGGLIQVLTGIITFITGVFTGNWETAWNGIKDIFAGVFNAISGICSSVMDGIKTAVGGAIDSIKSLLGMANGASVTVNTNEVSANAEGGIYQQGAFLTTFAEKSPEAAIPINHTARAVSLWRQTGELLGVMPNQQPVTLNMEQKPVDLSDGFRTLADSLDNNAGSQTIINQAARGSQQGTVPAQAPDRKQDIAISVNMGSVTIKNDDGKDLKTLGRELAGEILYNIQKSAINANVGAV